MFFYRHVRTATFLPSANGPIKILSAGDMVAFWFLALQVAGSSPFNGQCFMSMNSLNLT